MNECGLALQTWHNRQFTMILINDYIRRILLCHAMNDTRTIPYGTLGIIPLKSCTQLGKKVDKYLTEWRNQREHESRHTLAFAGYKRDSYILEAKTPRFGSGEGKGMMNDSVRGFDLYVMVDVCNYSLRIFS